MENNKKRQVERIPIIRKMLPETHIQINIGI